MFFVIDDVKKFAVEFLVSVDERSWVVYVSNLKPTIRLEMKWGTLVWCLKKTLRWLSQKKKRFLERN